jgi:broad specificity phosphatase PhoE
MRTIWFVRHGQSESNAGLPVLFPGSSVLTEQGQIQARHVATALPSAPDLIVTSPYIRTQLTAAPTIERFPTIPHEEWPVQEFHYLSLPRDRPSTLAERSPLAAAYWERCDPFYNDGPDVESFSDLLERVQTTKEIMLARPEHFIVVFSHGLFSRALLWSLLSKHVPLTSACMQRFRNFMKGIRMPNAAIMEFRCTEDRIYTGGICIDHLPDEMMTH